jgi:drug/metabolite transporter (DMT)-like permease
VKLQDLIIPALIGLPVAGAYFLAFIVASVINGGRSWPLWLLLLVVCCVLWGLAYSETQRNMSVIEPSRVAYSVWAGPQPHSSQPERRLSHPLKLGGIE